MQEEQRVIEAKIRMQQKEYQEQEKNLQKRQEVHPSNMLTVPGEIEYRDPSNNSCSGFIPTSVIFGFVCK